MWHPRLRRVDGDSILVELWGADDRPRVLLAESDGVVDVGSTTAFSVRPPAACRKQCDVGFQQLRPGT